MLAFDDLACRRKMRERLDRTLQGALACLVSMALVGFGCAGGEEEKTGELLREASRLVKSAREVEQISYAAAQELYEEALAKLERIVSRYPSSPAAQMLTREETKIGGYTLAALKRVVLPQIRSKAEAENSPLACALFVAQAIREPELRMPLLIEVAAAYAKIGKMDRASGLLARALEMAPEVVDIATRSDLLARIADLQAQAGHFDRALETVQGIEDRGSRARALAEVSVTYAQDGQRDMASETLSKALELAEGVEGAASRERTLAAIAVGYGEIGQYERVLDIAQTISDAAFGERAMTGIAGEYELARLSEKALKVGRTIEYFRTSALAAIAAKYAEVGKYDRAFHVAQTIENPEDRAGALVWIGRQYARAGESLKAKERTDQAFEAARTVDREEDRMSIFLWIADQYLQLGERTLARDTLSQALPLVDRMGYFKPSVQVAVAASYARTGDFDRALELARGIEEIGSKARALVGVAGVYMDAGDEGQGLLVLHQSLLVARTMKDSSAQAKELAGIAERYALAGFWDQALSVTESLGDSSLRARVLAEVACRYAEAGQKGEAERIFIQALQTARSLRDTNARVQALGEIAVKGAGGGQEGKALETLMNKSTKLRLQRTNGTLNTLKTR